MSLFAKYPELAPVSMFIKQREGDYTQHEHVDENLDADILFIFGIFPISENIKILLKNNEDIEVVFLVETLGELLFFINRKMDKGFDSDRIHVQWREEKKEDALWAEEIAMLYPYEKASFLQNNLPEDRYHLLSTVFARKIVMETSVHKELLNYPLLCKNLFRNIFKLTDSFDIGKLKDAFKGMPVVIVGAGPSLEKEAENLKKMEDKALIFAGGSAITALDKMGIFPHMLFAIDPNNEEYSRLRHSHCLSAPLIYGNRVQKDIFRFFPGETGYMRTDTGGLFEAFVDDALGIKDYGILKNLSDEALSVTSIALMTAIYLGCDQIYFAGVDLSVKGDKHYTSGLISNWESIKRKDDLQNTKWLMEKDVIDSVAKAHPRVDFYDATGNGMTFANVPAKKLDSESFSMQPNISLKIQNLILDAKFNISTFRIVEVMDEVKDSLKDLIDLIKKFQNSEIVENIFIYQVEANKSYKLFFQGMVYALQAPLMKKFKKSKDAISEKVVIKSIYSKVLKEAKELSSLI